MTRTRRGGRLFESWQTQIVRPIIVALLTALTLFLCSLAFRPVRGFLFSVDGAYPLWCTSEAYARAEESVLHVDVYVINPTDDNLTRDFLIERLNERLPDSNASPDLSLELWRNHGQVIQASEDKDFNRDKGGLDVSFKQEDRRILIRIDQIAPRAILKASVVIDGLPDRPGREVTRGTPSGNPFDMSHYHVACYSR